MPVEITKKYIRKRRFSPRKCSPKSFRVKTVSPRTKLVVCCLKGHYKKGRCQIGTRVQSILRKR